MCKRTRADENQVPALPPRYSAIVHKEPCVPSLFRRRRRLSSPPPYVDTNELARIEERLKQLDIFFGGAPL